MSDNINNNTTSKDDEMSLKELILNIKELFFYLLRKWRIIVIVGLLGGALGLVYSLLSTPKYIAKLSFAVQEKGNSGGGLAALAGQFGVNIGGGTEGVFSGSNIIELLKSKYLIEQALLSEVDIDNKKQYLIEYYIDKNKLREEDNTLPSFPLEQKRSSYTRLQDSTLNVFTLALTQDKLNVVKLSKETSIVNISYIDEDELFAKDFIELLVKKVTYFYVQSRTEVPRTNLAKMEHRADSIKRSIDSLMFRRARRADRNLDVIRLEPGVQDQKDQIAMQLAGTVYGELIKNIEAMKVDIIRETPLIQLIDRPILPLEVDKVGKVKGIAIGGILAGFLIVVYLLSALYYRRIMAEGESNA